MNQTEFYNRAIALYLDSLDEHHGLFLQYCQLSIGLVIVKSLNQEHQVENCLNIKYSTALIRNDLSALTIKYLEEKALALGIKKVIFESLEVDSILDWCRKPENLTI
ncbi:MAG TPA: hypothetical protein V6D15_00865 [Oculatellaceae cyanobacterium]|jgi:hypothetical protein